MARTIRVNAKRRPRLGQNFLSDPHAAQRIVDALGDLSGSTVVEIGPGRGALTDLLARRARRLIAIEVDRLLAAQLGLRYARQPNVEIVEADILSVDLSSLIAIEPGAVIPRRVGGRAVVVGNLPYYITSPILMRLFTFAGSIERIVVLVQREVAERVIARPGTRDYGVLSATAQLYARVEKLFTLPPGAFSPPPKVHSTLLRLTISPRDAELGIVAEEFVEFLKLCFGQKRKTLRNNLKFRYEEPAVLRALAEADVRGDVRAEALSLEKTAALFHSLRHRTPAIE
ncbi:MAG TPA: 16S rRNA (adenine(1518)-N(6)/adenine(1519)-N(6))-dimethyltransferase RsmA [Terriglobales bacterium]|nr:16S rRNA (adenine(1518)-N(6)/adenine(1519)-N(6))-dimethyltransferase RsmA [Terriglobales bacterium]